MQLSDHFTFRHLLRYTFPSVVMMIFTSVYGVVDGFFVSNFVGKTPFAAVNFIMPLLMMMGSVGFMFGTGGSALISKTLGEGNPRRANEIFSMVVVFSVLCGALLTGVGFLLLRPVAVAMGRRGSCSPTVLPMAGSFWPLCLSLFFNTNFSACLSRPESRIWGFSPPWRQG